MYYGDSSYFLCVFFAPEIVLFTQLLLALNHAVSHESRTEAFKKALKAFSHKDVELHNYEMNLGVDKALCLKLGYVVVTYKNSSEQIDLVCQCLTKVYQCSLEHRINSFREIGASEIVPLLVQIWKHHMQVTYDDNLREKECILLSTMQVFRIYAKLDEAAKSFLIHYDDGALVANFMKMVASHCEKQRQSPMGNQSPILVVEILGIIKDLTFRSHPSDKEFLLRAYGGISKNALSLCCGVLMTNPKVAELVTAILWNLALTPSLSIELLQSEPDHLVFPRAICRALTSRNPESGRTIREYHYSTKTRRNAVSALGNILLSTDSKTMLMRRPNEQQLRLIRTVMDLVEHDTDSITRRRAMRTIRCLSSVTQDMNISAEHAVRCQCSCVEILMEHDVVSFLVRTISRNVDEDDDNDRDTQIQACESVVALSMASLVKEDDWMKLEQTLILRVESTTDPRLTLAACRCLSVSRSGNISNPEKRIQNSFQRGSKFSDMFWRRLEYAVLHSKESHLGISQFLLLLAQHEANLDASASPNSLNATAAATAATPSSLAHTTVINTITHLLSESGCQFEESRNKAVEVVTILVEKECNKRPLAENERLLTALVNVCLLHPSGPTSKRDAAKQLILELVPEL